jgi:hypothetical protein
MRLRLAKKPDLSQAVTPAFGHTWPQSRVEASALLAAWVTIAERDVAAADRPQPDLSPQVDALLATKVLRPSAGGWLRVWNQLRSAIASREYTKNPATPALPPAVSAYFLERWHYDAQFEMACMGGASQGYTDIVDPGDEDRTALLLELPDSTLFGWSWGDVDNLVVAGPIEALRRSDFSCVVAGVTNGSR